MKATKAIKKVLVIGYVWPEPNSSAAGSHMLSILRMCVEQNWQVCFASPAQLGEHRFDLTAMGITEQNIALNCESFDEFISTYAPDMVLFDRFMMEEQFGWRVAEQCPQALRVLDTEDLHCLRSARELAHKQKRTMQTKDLMSDLAKREIAAIFRCDVSLIISDFELSLLRNTFGVPDALLHHCPFMLDLSPLESSSGLWHAREHFISLGNFRHGPNWDAVLWLKQEIWPLIRAQLPKAELHIYGAYPPPKATQLHNAKQGFMVKGWAEDSSKVMRQARVCLAPLRFGAGIKGKLSEAMLCATPSVTTDIGIEGMHGGLPWPGLVGNSAEEFANAAIALYSDEIKWQEAKHNGPTLLRNNFCEAKNQALLIQKIVQTHTKLEQHRIENFMGAMLQHHHHQSTKYMAQWIAAKNLNNQ